MTGLIVDIILIVSLLLFVHIGFQSGIVRTFFALAAGFFATVIAKHYPYQIGINYYLIFCVSAAGIYITGLFVLKFVDFIFMSIFDKFAGLCAGILVWFIFSANCLIPSLAAENIKETKISSAVSLFSSKIFPGFGKYRINVAVDVTKMKDADKYILYKKELL